VIRNTVSMQVTLLAASAMYLFGVSLGWVTSRVRNARVRAAVFLALSIAAVAVPLLLRRHVSRSLHPQILSIVLNDARLWWSSVALVTGVLYGRMRTQRRPTTGIKIGNISGASIAVLSVFMILAVGVIRLSHTRFAPLSNIVISGQPTYAVIDDAPVHLSSTYFDFWTDAAVRLELAGESITVATLDDAILTQVDVSTPGQTNITAERSGDVLRIGSIADVRNNITDRAAANNLVLESAHLAPEPIDGGISPQTFNWQPKHVALHAVLLSPVKAFAELDIEVPPNAEPLVFGHPSLDRDVKNYFMVSMRYRPTWNFGSQWFTAAERESRKLLNLYDRGTYVVPAIRQMVDADIGRLAVKFGNATDVILVLDESYVFSGLRTPRAGLIIIFCRGLRRIDFVPIRQPAESRIWGVGAEEMDDAEAFGQSTRSFIELGNFQGRIMTGQTERLVETDVNSLVISSEPHAKVRTEWRSNRVRATCTAEWIKRADLNGATLFPTEWDSLSIEARLGIFGAVSAFLIGVIAANKATAARVLRWVFLPRTERDS
jgi:hypothetical protein